MDTACTNAALKLLGYTIILTLIQMAEPGLYAGYEAIGAVAVALTIVGLFGDAWILPRFRNLPSLAMGALGMVAIVWFIPKLFPATHVTLWAAIWQAIPMGAFEFLIHRYLFRAPTL
ncbi:MAG: YndM family protein [Alicyclobacillus sp.]|nr:YndM family protein [Alicyclobacillus sp.]